MCGVIGSVCLLDKENLYFWLFCEQVLVFGSMNVLCKNYVDFLVYFILVECEGNVIVCIIMDFYVVVFLNVLGGDGCSEISILFYLINCCDKIFFQELKVVVKCWVDIWVLFFEVYFISYMDQFMDEIEDVVVLN